MDPSLGDYINNNRIFCFFRIKRSVVVSDVCLCCLVGLREEERVDLAV